VEAAPTAPPDHGPTRGLSHSYHYRSRAGEPEPIIERIKLLT